MKKLNSVVYHKLLLQAQEAKTQNLTKLASGIISALGPVVEDEHVQYDRQQLQNEVYDGMWKLATHVIKYHDVDSADAGKIHDSLEALANKFIEELEQSLGVENVIAGPLEPILPGEKRVNAEYHIIKHEKNHSCPKCGKPYFCKDCGVCSECKFCTDPQ